MMRTLVVGGLALVLALPAPSRAQDAEAEIRATVRTLFNAMRRVDSAAARSVFHPRARLLSLRPDGSVQVEESADAFMRAIGRPRQEVWDERTFNEQIHVDGGLASAWMDYSFYRGATLDHCGVDHLLLVKDGARWKIIELSDTQRREGCSARPPS